MILNGRRKIVTEFKENDLSNLSNVTKMVNSALNTHISNSIEIEHLFEYFKGNQEILNKRSEVRPEINNIVLVNHAQMITRTIINYFIGTPIQYTQSGQGNYEDDEMKRIQIEKLNSYLEYGDSASVDLEVAESQSICGTAYRIIFSSDENEIPFSDRILDPQNTFVIYENTVICKPIAGVTYVNLVNEDGLPSGRRYECYTEKGLYIYESSGNNISNEDFVSFNPYDVGGVPLIEYPNNRYRIGDWELVISIMDTISKLYSNRIDDIEQIVNSLLVFINAEIDERSYSEMRRLGIISLVNNSDGKTSDIKTINNPLDQTGIAKLSSELKDLLYSLVGIPSRDNRASGGGDTGTAVELRDGWADLENVIRSKEVNFKRCERLKLKIITTMLNNVNGFNLTPLDISIKFSRNKNNNLLVKSQSLTNLLSTKTMSPVDCLASVDLTTDISDAIQRGRDFWQDEFGGKIPQNEYKIVTDINGNENKSNLSENLENIGTKN